MKLSKIDLPLSMSTTINEPYNEAIIPLLKNSKTYKRGVAFFTSSWIELAAEGLIRFVNAGGKMKLLTSIELGEEEYKALKLGEEAKKNEILKRELISKVEETLNSNNKWTFNYLSWLIASEVLEVRFSIHKKNRRSIYHDKISIFSDGEEKVCINGSLNDSMNALSNQETINIFISWDKRDSLRIDELEKYFDNAWNDKVDEYNVYKLPEILIEEFKKKQNDYNPYIKLINKNTKTTNEKPKYDIREYQEEAIKALQSHNWRGILNMATGTGKTLTSLFATERFLESNPDHVVCIVVPQLHLLYQWEDIITKKYNDIEILKCAENKSEWGSKIYRYARNKMKKQLYILTTYKTLIDDTFQDGMMKFNEKVIYIFDECHKLGSNEIKRKLVINDNSKRIGLSATPNRWLDKDGNVFIEDKIGEEVFEFSLEKAIGKYLTPYEYYPHFSELNDREFSEFLDLTSKIGRISSYSNRDEQSSNKSLESLLNKRASISKGAENKFEDFFKVFDRQKDKRYTLVYVYDLQVEKMVQLLKERYSLNVHGIIATTKINDRTKILNSFNDGEIDIIVAIQCLDEGVDIPNCRYAYVLASSTNPREFIQRRGRVLRKSENKDKGIIHDFVTIAPDSDLYENNEKSIVIKRELQRVAEFVRLSMNKKDEEIISYLTNIKTLSDYGVHNPWNMNIIEREEETNE